MYLSDIIENKDKKFILVYNKDSRYEKIVEEMYRDIYKIPNDVVIKPKAESDLGTLVANGYTTPLGFNHWLYIINSDVHLKISRDVFEKIVKTETATFIIFVDNFKSFKFLLNYVDRSPDADKLTMTYLNFYAVETLIANYFRPKAYTQTSLDNLATIGPTLSKGYGNKPNVIYDILDFIITHQNKKLTKHDIVELFGPADNTVEKFVIKLLIAQPKQTQRSINSIMSKRTKEGHVLVQEYGSEYLRRSMITVVKDLINLKSYYIDGRFYKDIHQIKDLTTTEIGHLSKYSRYLEDIKIIPLSKLIALFKELTAPHKWFNEVDFFDFLYRYLQYIILKY